MNLVQKHILKIIKNTVELKVLLRNNLLIIPIANLAIVVIGVGIQDILRVIAMQELTKEGIILIQIQINPYPPEGPYQGNGNEGREFQPHQRPHPQLDKQEAGDSQGDSGFLQPQPSSDPP